MAGSAPIGFQSSGETPIEAALFSVSVSCSKATDGSIVPSGGCCESALAVRIVSMSALSLRAFMDAVDASVAGL